MKNIEPTTADLEAKINVWVYSLRQKIYIYTRWTFKHDPEGIRSLELTFDLSTLRDEFERFKAALKTLLTNTQNWNAFEADLQAEFMNGINHYYNWYHTSTEYRAYFGADSPYDIILNVAESTEREILKYFPELIKKTDSNNIPVTSPQLITNSKANVSIYILPDARPALINDLLPFVDSAQHDSLKALINEGLEPEQPIVCRCEQVLLGKIFYEMVKEPAKKNRHIQADKTKLAQWIYLHFNRYENGSVRKLSEPTILNYLKNKGFSSKE